MVTIMAGSVGQALPPLLLLVFSVIGASEGALSSSGRGFNSHEDQSSLTTSMTDFLGIQNFEILKMGVPAVDSVGHGGSVRANKLNGHAAGVDDGGAATRAEAPTLAIPSPTQDLNSEDIHDSQLGGRGETKNKRELAKLMREQFDEFKERLARTAQDTASSQGNKASSSPSALATNTSVDVGSSIVGGGVASGKSLGADGSTGDRVGRVHIGEVVSKSERRAGEEPSGIKSGILRVDAHPIPVTFTSLPGFPSFPRTTTAGSAGGGVGSGQSGAGALTGDSVAAPGVGVGANVGSLTPVRGETTAGVQRPPGSRGPVLPRVPGGVGGTRLTGILGVPGGTRGGSGLRGPPRRTPGEGSNGVGNLMRLLESRLIGGLRGPTTATTPGASPIHHFDPSIVVNFLTLVALSQQQRRGGSGSSSPGQRNAALAEGAPLTLPVPSADSEFGPFSTGNDPSAGIDPSTILLPPMLRQTLYSYLLPRLASLTALVETVPGVPGLDYPIISSVPYTNFYCSDMPWPGFYADTEARCQVWHYCDLDGRQASFLCPNGTMFNQAFFVCDWWYNLDCQSAPYLYSLNERVFALPEVDETAPHRTLTAEILETIFL